MRLKKTCAAACLLLLSGCVSSDDGDFSQYWRMMRQTFRGGFGNSAITLKQAAAIPYASMGWRLNGGNQSIIVLATDNGQGQLWTSAAHTVILTQDGRIKRTVGLPHDIAAMAPRSGAAMAPPAQALTGPYQDQRSVDFGDIGVFGAPLSCRATARGAQAVTILGKKIQTVRIEERCDSRPLNWSFTNLYWVNRETGFVWRSLQHIHPGGDTIETEIFRPPG